jgi:filamentous hemagglutinin
LWGKQLSVITGANEVNYASLGVQLIEGTGSAPTVAIDVARLGGMYGDRIRLVGTEAGVGVNSGGAIVAGSGNLVIDSMGKLTLSGVARAGAGIALHGADGVVNDGVVSAGGDLTITGAGIASTGTLAAGVDAAGAVGKSGNLTMTVSGRLGATGSNIAGGQLALDGASLDLSGAATEAGADMKLTARHGDIGLGARTVAAGNMALTAKAGTVRNGAAIRDASRMVQSATIEIDAADLDNTNGTISQTGDQASAIRLTGKLANGGGSIASNGVNMTLESGTLDNHDGEIRHAGAGLLSVSASDIQNQRGAITGRGASTINAASLDNTHGRVTAMGTDGLRVTVTGALTNIGMTAPDGSTLGQIGSNGATTISAGTVRNSGIVSATGALAVNAAGWLDNSDGKLLSDGLLTSTAGAAWTNTAGAVAGKQISLTGGSLSNVGGLISQTGAGNTTINVHTGLLDNQHGTIESNGGKLTVTSGKLVNDDGVIDHAGDGLLRIDSGELSNLKGEPGNGAIRSNGDIVITAAAVTNGGAISAQKSIQLSATSLRNDSGTLASNAALTVRAGTLLTNVNGALHAGAASKPASASVSALTLDNSGGEISAGTLEIDATTLTNSNGLINQSNQAGSATFTVRQTLDNRAGEIAVAAADLTLAPTTTLRNDGGTITHTGSGMLTVSSGSLVNDGGKLGSNGQALVTVRALSNRAGTLTAVSTLDITSTATVDKSAVDAVAGVLAGSSVTVTTNNDLVDNRGSIIEATDGLVLHAQSLDNSGGAIRNQGAAALTVNATGTVVNIGGTLRSRGDVNVGGEGIDNRHGAITADGSATVASGAKIDNGEGSIQALGNVRVNAAGDLHNAGGKIRALGENGTLVVSAAGMDNTSGRMVNTGSGATVISAVGEIVNANPDALDGAGVMGGNGDVNLNAAVLRNGQNAKLAAGGALTLNTTALLDNSGGKLLAGGMLRMKQAAASVINEGGEISGQQVDLASASLDNTNGLISNPKGSGGNITVNTGALVNRAGSISSDQDLWLTAPTILGQGRIAGGRDATVRLQGNYTNAADNVIAANGTLTLSTTGVLINAGTLAAAGNVTLNAAGISNLSGAVIASGSSGDMLTGATTLNAAGGEIDNAGRIEGNTVNASSSGFHNSGSVIGDMVTIAADRIDNDGSGAIIAAVGQLNLWARDALANRNGATLFSLGDMHMAADGSRDAHGELVHRTRVIDNLSSTIEADGELQVAAEVVNNVRLNVRTESVLIEDRTYKLTPLPWWTSMAPGVGTPERNSNTTRLDAYYLSPDAIISSEPVITPDGHVVHRAVVRIKASDSVFQWMGGGLGYPLPDGGNDIEFGSQSRMLPKEETRVI